MDAYLNIQTIVRHKMKQIANHPMTVLTLKASDTSSDPHLVLKESSYSLIIIHGSTRAKTVFFII